MQNVYAQLKEDIDNAQLIFDGYASQVETPENREARDYYLRYWAGYLDGANNALNFLTGMEAN